MSTNELNQHVAAATRWEMQVDKTDSCWLWTGSLSAGRYGSFMVNGKNVKAHRWAYEQFVGPIPDGLQIDHMCGVTRCVNPTHLRPVTPRENVLAHWREQRGTCRNGHAMTEENSAWRVGGTVRRCRVCDRARLKRYREKCRDSANA